MREEEVGSLKKKGIALSASDFSVQRSHPPILIKSCEKVEKLCTSCHSLHELFENSDSYKEHHPLNCTVSIIKQSIVSLLYIYFFKTCKAPKINKCFLKEIGIFKDLIAGKSGKIGKIGQLYSQALSNQHLCTSTKEFTVLYLHWNLNQSGYTIFAVSLELATTQILLYYETIFYGPLRGFFAANLEESFNILGKELAS